MATFEFAGGLTADIFNDIDDPFSDSVPLPDIDGTSDGESFSPEHAEDEYHENVVLPDEIDEPFDNEWMPTGAFSRPSGAIPMPLFVDEPALARQRGNWSERALILGLSTIIVAASVTAVREHKGDPRVAVWVSRASMLWAALLPSEAAIAADPSQRQAPLALPNKSLVASSRVGAAPVTAVLASKPPVVPVYPTELAPALAPQEHAAQAAAPMQLAELVVSSRNRAPANASERHAAPAPAAPKLLADKLVQHKAQTRAEAAPSASREALASAARAEARGHYAARQYAQAVAAYEEAVKQDPSYALTFAGLGAARLQLGDTRGAIRAYERAVQLSPSSVVLHSGLAGAYLRDGNTARARASYERALALDPSNAAAKVALSRL